MTLSTSAIKTGLQYFTAALFCALFGAVYELFSHSVFSYYMLYAFMIPLVGGVIVIFPDGVIFSGRFPGKFLELMAVWDCSIDCRLSAAGRFGNLRHDQPADDCLLGDRRSISYRRSSCIFCRRQTTYGVTDKKEWYFDLRTIIMVKNCRCCETGSNIYQI